MTYCLTLHVPISTVHLESDNESAITDFSNFCKKVLGAYNSTSDPTLLSVDSISDEQLVLLQNELSKLSPL